MTLLRRATEAEDALLARTMSEQEAAGGLHAALGQSLNHPTTATTDSVGLQRALSSSLQTQGEEEELQLALALALSVSVSEPARPPPASPPRPLL